MKQAILVAAAFLTAPCAHAAPDSGNGQPSVAVPASDSRCARPGGSFVSGRKPEKGTFLIARRGLPDPNFAETVVLIVGYDEKGAMGLVVNRPTRMQLSAALDQFEELEGREDMLYAGGPVSRLSVFVLLRGEPKAAGATEVFDSVYLTTDTDTLRAELRKKRPATSLRVYAGYAGWGSGQLDRELLRGDWYVAPADAATIFEKDVESVWPDLIRHFEGQWAAAPRSFPSWREENRCPTNFPG
jgi:putative transcriptional regulator